MEKNVRNLTCIVCPKGCELTVTFGEGGSIEKVEGFTCKRGEVYAVAECTYPVRTVTTTVKTVSGKPIAVKTERAIPKELIFAAMAEINAIRLPDDNEPSIGEVIIPDLCGTGVAVVVSGR